MIKLKLVANNVVLLLSMLLICCAEANRGELLETITGDFNGDGVEEQAELYYIFTGEGGVDDDPVYVGCDDNYDIYFSDNSIAPLSRDIIQWAASNLTNEGDLNGDGTDELGVWIRGGYTACGTYVVFTYKDSKWSELIHISHNPNWNGCDYQELVSVNDQDPTQLIVMDVCPDGRVKERLVDLTTKDGVNFKYTDFVLIDLRDGYVDQENNVFIEGWIKPAEGFEGWYDVQLQLSQSGCKLLKPASGRISQYEVDKYKGKSLESSCDYDEKFVTAPDDLFFFADLDFDGVNEFITSITPFAGSQRDCSAYTAIYRRVNGEYKNVTRQFVDKCEVFGMIDPLGWSIDYTTKEIYHSNIAGVYQNVTVYKFVDGEYIFDRTVTFDYEDGSDIRGVIKVLDSNENIITSLDVTKYDCEKNWWDYVRYLHLKR